MRLNFGVRLRDQPSRREHWSNVVSGPLAGTYSSAPEGRGRGRIGPPVGAADKWLGNTAPPQLLVSADWRPRISASRVSTAALLPHRTMATDEPLNVLRQRPSRTPAADGYPAPATVHRRRAAPDVRAGKASTTAARRLRDSADKRRYASTWRTALLRLLIPSGGAANKRLNTDAISGDWVVQGFPVTPRVSRCRAAASPNVALQPTCGARLWRGGELRRRRMRLNFGVRLRQQLCR
jgi:hypothetical protein